MSNPTDSTHLTLKLEYPRLRVHVTRQRGEEKLDYYHSVSADIQIVELVMHEYRQAPSDAPLLTVELKGDEMWCQTVSERLRGQDFIVFCECEVADKPAEGRKQSSPLINERDDIADVLNKPADRVEDLPATLRHMVDAYRDETHPYHMAVIEMMEVYHQMALGKGLERHANELPFQDQPMQANADLNGIGFINGQAAKKLRESVDLPLQKALIEIRGACVYALGAAIYRKRHNQD